MNDQDIVTRLKIRASIRRSITTREQVGLKLDAAINTAIKEILK